MGMQRHIRCKEGDVGEYVLIPGDLERARKIAEKLESPRLISKNREFIVYTGRIGSVAVSVCSTGIGGPSASIAVEELTNIGAKYFIRVGSAGARQEDIPIGGLIIATGAYRGEGTSQAYAPLPFPAVADMEVTLALEKACEKLGYSYFKGIVYTRDAFYVQDWDLNRFLKDAGVVAAEQECATVFVVGTMRRVKVGAILATDSNIWLKEQPSQEEKEKLFKEAEEKAIEVSIEAVRILIEGNKK
ncbi:MAG: nucleoside phosphorylase [Thermotoga sp.]|nr:MAG: nucleoside phosphorylase [Thermotoga sp.]